MSRARHQPGHTTAERLTESQVEQGEQVELTLGGMTCAGCAAGIEKQLNRLDGVSATVNFATERASVHYDPAAVGIDELVAQVEAIGYTATPPPGPTPPGTAEYDGVAATDDGAEDPQLRALRERLVASAVLSVPVLVLSMIPALQFRNWQWLAFTLAAPVATWGAWPFHRAAWMNLRHGRATMDTLISVGVIAAFGWSTWALFLGTAGDAGMTMSMALGASSADGGASNHLYLEVASSVVVFILAGRFFETRAKRRAGDALRALAGLAVRDASVIDDEGTERLVPVAELLVGDRFVVRPGERIATDGTVVDGSSAVDNSLVTGESVPVEVGPGDQVIGSTVNAGGRIVVRVERVGQDTALGRIARLVNEAQTGKAPVQRLADRVAGIFVPVVIGISLATLVTWLVLGNDTTAAFSAAVAVLIIACPCALGLATPTALLVGTGRGAQLGILIRGPEVLESTRRVDTILLDKTGTVTTGRMRVIEVVPADGGSSPELLAMLGAVESASEHPIARAIAAAARQAVEVPAASDFVSHAGLGVSGSVEGRDVLAGRVSFLAERGIGLSEALSARCADAEASGQTVVAVAVDGSATGLVVVADAPRDTSAAAIAGLSGLGLRTILLTGDNEAVAHRVAAGVGIDEVIAEVLPGDKLAVVRRLQGEGRVVAMVGDGVNDAAALAGADLGLAMGSGTDVAIAASDLTLMRSDLTAAVDAIRLSRRTLSTIKVNLFWAFAYNVAAIPLAAAGVLNPLIAGAAMACSSVFVVSNSLRLRRFRGALVGSEAPT